MTFLIITDDPSAGVGLAECLKERAPGSICFSMPSSAAEEALNAVQVDCVVCPPELAEFLSRRKLPRLAVWPPEVRVEAMAEALMPHHV